MTTTVSGGSILRHTEIEVMSGRGSAARPWRGTARRTRPARASRRTAPTRPARGTPLPHRFSPPLRSVLAARAVAFPGLSSLFFFFFFSRAPPPRGRTPAARRPVGVDEDEARFRAGPRNPDLQQVARIADHRARRRARPDQPLGAWRRRALVSEQHCEHGRPCSSHSRATGSLNASAFARNTREPDGPRSTVRPATRDATSRRARRSAARVTIPARPGSPRALPGAPRTALCPPEGRARTRVRLPRAGR